MTNKVPTGFLIILGLVFAAWIASAPNEKVKAGDSIEHMSLLNIHGVEISIPSVKSKWVHLQFRRFAGCPICNLHMKSFVQRSSEITAAGIQEVAVFHSPLESLIPYQGKFPFDVIADPEKKLYSKFGVGSSIFAILDVRAWPSMYEGHALKDRPQGDPEGGALGRPADFLIAADRRVVASHYGRHAYDQWSVDQLLALTK